MIAPHLCVLGDKSLKTLLRDLAEEKKGEKGEKAATFVVLCGAAFFCSFIRMRRDRVAAFL